MPGLQSVLEVFSFSSWTISKMIHFYKLYFLVFLKFFRNRIFSENDAKSCIYTVHYSVDFCYAFSPCCSAKVSELFTRSSLLWTVWTAQSKNDNVPKFPVGLYLLATGDWLTRWTELGTDLISLFVWKIEIVPWRNNEMSKQKLGLLDPNMNNILAELFT